MLKRENKSREWVAIQKLELCPGVCSFSDDREQVTLGEAQAALGTLLRPDEVPDAAGIQDLHRTIFARVHPWAGRFNVPGEDV